MAYNEPMPRLKKLSASLIPSPCSLRYTTTNEIPSDRHRDVVLYYNPVVKQKLTDGQIQFRVRGTTGGNLLLIPYDVSARTADLDVVKLLMHSVISSNRQWMTIDIKDYYLGTPLPSSRYEYLRIPLRMIPSAVLECYNLQPYIAHGHVYFEIRKCMYGLPQAGKLSQVRLIDHLAQHRFTQCPNTLPLPSRNPQHYFLSGGGRPRRTIWLQRRRRFSHQCPSTTRLRAYHQMGRRNVPRNDRHV